VELTALAALCPARPIPFTAWLRHLIDRLKSFERSRIRAGIDAGIQELLACGTTHVGDVTATWLSVEPLLASPLRGIVWLEVAGLRRQASLDNLEEAKAAIRSARRRPASGRMQVGLSVHAPYSCHPDLFRAAAAWCIAEDVPLCVHLAESPGETQWLARGSGPFATDLAPRLRVNAWSVPRLRPVQYMERLGVLAARPTLVHAVHVTRDDIASIARRRCAVVHCPRSNVRLSCGRMPLERYLAADVRVYLGSDSRASSPSLNVREEAASAVLLHAPHVRARDIRALLSVPLAS
jgi:cytosine/adenosine deaminase-related metal-dependent hydrolase